MSRTKRFDNGFNKGRDDKPFDARCFPDSDNPRGFDTFNDDHGYYGAGGHHYMKKAASAARRIYNKEILHKELTELNGDRS